ncbi:MAG: PfkB family carbohydrate kinase [Eubacteriales bacterium]|nr:PfkB family carbohydrate kinase [Eubacteriales bacterium]
MTVVRILGIGVATMDIYVDRKKMYPGGNEYNVACNARQLGAEAGFLGVFGNDAAGRILEDTLKDQKVDVSRCHHETGSSGYSLVRLLENGDREFLEWNQQGVTDLYPIGFDEEEIKYCRSFDVASLGRCASVSYEKICQLAEAGIPICYDFHAIFGEKELQRYAPRTTYAFFSCSHLTDQEIRMTLQRAVDLGCKIAIGTRGVDPVIAYDGHQFYEQETCRVKATDALGAGDSYIGAFLTFYLGFMKEGTLSQEEMIQRSLKQAVEHSATVVVKEGSIGVGYDVDPNKLDEVINMR